MNEQKEYSLCHKSFMGIGSYHRAWKARDFGLELQELYSCAVEGEIRVKNECSICWKDDAADTRNTWLRIYKSS
jgi:hypothetical protein